MNSKNCVARTIFVALAIAVKSRALNGELDPPKRRREYDLGGPMESEALRPRTLMLPPAPYVAALIGGWWLDRNVFRLHWDGGAATQSLGWLLVGVGVGLFAWARMTFSRQHTTLNHSIRTRRPRAFAPAGHSASAAIRSIS